MPYQSKASATPTTKVTAGTIMGAVTTLVIWGLESFAGVEVDPQAAAAIATLAFAVTAYLVPDWAPE